MEAGGGRAQDAARLEPQVVSAAGRTMTKFIDIHGHCVLEHFVPCKDWKIDGVRCHLISNPSEMLEFYDRHGVEKGVLMPLCNAENAPQSQSNEEVLEIARRHPDRFIPYCNVDPRNLFNDFSKSRFADTLKWYRDKGCKGLGEMCCNLHFLDPRVQALMSAAEDVGFPMTFHMAPFAGNSYGLVDEAGMPELEESLKRHPKLKIFGHSQAFWAEIGKNPSMNDRLNNPTGEVKEEGRLVELMRAYPNLYGDLSAGSGGNALMRDRAYAVKFLNEFQDRLLFGMDICSPEAERKWPKPLSDFLRDLYAKGEISETVFNKVGRDNAVRLLGL